MGAACVVRGPRRGGALGRRVGSSPLPTSASAASVPSPLTRPPMGVLGFGRSLEWLLGFYFLSHIPITLFIDLQAVLPRELYPVELRNLLSWYTKEFRDPLLQDPPTWFKSFLFCELVFQLPFFPFATYAFFKGGCKWIRIPAIIYSVHVLTTLIPILSEILFGEFSKAAGFKGQGPKTLHERLTLLSVYAPYFLIPLMLLLFMLQSPYYKYEGKRKKN
ncbi:sigma intracellular receptor 2 [Dasypus novemcinctus]|uniref:sigma intracellular receptor 2 n=1 Tax=Dasypus novemcinctus TaxID=9361 RepID=UPI0003290561|nr:sigma intracellular receptor 2 [Dasypus novemcinctus]